MEKKFDCFLTHDWGTDEENRSNHDRVVKVSHVLRERGIIPWIDEKEMTGDIDDQMCDGIDLSSCVVVFITKRYHDKVTGKNVQDNCRKEFKYSESTKGSTLMIPVIMEKRMRNTSLWKGIIQMHIGKILYVDMSSDDPNDMKNSIEHLIKEIITRVPSIIQQQQQQRLITTQTATTATPQKKEEEERKNKEEERERLAKEEEEERKRKEKEKEKEDQEKAAEKLKKEKEEERKKREERERLAKEEEEERKKKEEEEEDQEKAAAEKLKKEKEEEEERKKKEEEEGKKKQEEQERLPKVVEKMEFDGNFCSTTITLSGNNLIATRTSGDEYSGGVLGTIKNPKSFKIKLLIPNSDGDFNTYIGLAPKENFKFSGRNYNSCGWYLDCESGNLWSQDGDSSRKYLETTDCLKKSRIIEVIYEKEKEKISYKIDGKDCGVAFENINKKKLDLFAAFDLTDFNESFQLIE